MKPTHGIIYGIRLKGQDQICYVGQTCMKLKYRQRRYLTDKTRMAKAIQMMGGIEAFEFLVLETVALEALNERERYWIAALNTMHPAGLNLTSGGSRSGRVSNATKKRMSDAKKATCADPEYRAALSARAKAMWSSPEGRAKKRAIWTDEKRAEMSDRMRDQAGTDAWREKVSAGATKAFKDPEARRRVSEGLRRRWADPAARAEQSAKIKAARARKKAEAANAG